MASTIAFILVEYNTVDQQGISITQECATRSVFKPSLADGIAGSKRTAGRSATSQRDNTNFVHEENLGF